MELNWEPMGHALENVYSVPHFVSRGACPPSKPMHALSHAQLLRPLPCLTPGVTGQGTFSAQSHSLPPLVAAVGGSHSCRGGSMLASKAEWVPPSPPSFNLTPAHPLPAGLPLLPGARGRGHEHHRWGRHRLPRLACAASGPGSAQGATSAQASLRTLHRQCGIASGAGCMLRRGATTVPHFGQGGMHALNQPCPCLLSRRVPNRAQPAPAWASLRRPSTPPISPSQRPASRAGSGQI